MALHYPVTAMMTAVHLCTKGVRIKVGVGWEGFFFQTLFNVLGTHVLTTVHVPTLVNMHYYQYDAHPMLILVPTAILE